MVCIHTYYDTNEQINRLSLEQNVKEKTKYDDCSRTPNLDQTRSMPPPPPLPPTPPPPV